jgi:hypothetical protein
MISAFGGVASDMMIVIMMASLLNGGSAVRASAFEAACPVPARVIYANRLAAQFAMVVLPAMAWLVAGAAAGPRVADGLFVIGAPLKLLIMSVLVLGVTLPHARSPGVLSLAGWRTTVPAWVFAVGTALVFWYIGHPVAGAVLLLLVAAATLVYTWHAMPHSFQLRGMTIGRSGSPGPSRLTRPWWWPILVSAVGPEIIFGSLLAGAMGFSDSWPFYLAMFGGGSYVMLPARLVWLRHLPVSRHALTLVAMAPVVVPLAAVLVIGKGVMRHVPGFNTTTAMGLHEYDAPRHDFDWHTTVAIEYWEPAPGGRAQVIRAPWGETSEADTVSMLGHVYYNPYSARRKSSAAFREWQFGRVTERMFGQRFTIAQYDADDFSPPPKRFWGARHYLLGSALALTIAALVTSLLYLHRWNRLVGRPLLRKAAMALGAACLWGILAVEIAGMFRKEYFIVPHAKRLIIWIAETLPNTGAVVLVAVLPVLLAYALLHWQLGHAEWSDRAPTPRPLRTGR